MSSSSSEKVERIGQKQNWFVRATGPEGATEELNNLPKERVDAVREALEKRHSEWKVEVGQL